LSPTPRLAKMGRFGIGSRSRFLAINKPGGSLGTFAGVFTPSVLTILGIILFLRLGYVTGSAGLGRVLIMIGLANVISVLTSVSLAAIATNLKVKGGGDYYLISRTLGLEFGGALGIVLFLAQAVSIAFYSIGFGEAVATMIPGGSLLTPRLVAMMAVAFLFVLAWLGADWATRFQYVVMTLLGLALISFFVGGIPGFSIATISANWDAPAGDGSFWTLFAIFFPAVTGFTQGVSMSGDLADAGRSLPMGTFLAVGVSIIVYFAVAIIFAGNLPSQVLMQDYNAMQKVARWSFLIDAGVIAATLSSAMASFLGAPRILQSLSSDRIFPFLNPFAIGTGPTNNPRRGVLLAAAIALMTVAIGNLNLIAPVVAMFFLISYGLLNYATYFEAKAASPSFRPRFKWFDRRLSLLGFLACFGTMLAIDFKTGLIAVAILFAIYQYLKHTAGPARWADSRRAYHLHQVRKNLLAANSDLAHPRDWRPQMLVFSNDPDRRRRLLALAAWFEGQSGLTTLVKLVVQDNQQNLAERDAAQAELAADLARYESNAFPLAIITDDFECGISHLLQAFGIGPLKANTILINWLNPLPQTPLGFRTLLYGRQLGVIRRMGCNVVVLSSNDTLWSQMEAQAPEKRRIDVLWQNDATGRLMLLLAYLTTRNEPWDEAEIRVLVPALNEDQADARANLEPILEEARIAARPVALKSATDAGIVEATSRTSLLFLPFRLQGSMVAPPFEKSLEQVLEKLPVTVLVTAAEDIDLGAAPEEGLAGERAEAIDNLNTAEKKLHEAEKIARKARLEADKSEAEFKKLQSEVEAMHIIDDAKTPILSAVDKEAQKAAKEADKAHRKAANAKARLSDAAKEVSAFDPASGTEVRDSNPSGPNSKEKK
jgi:amino acid transporter